MYCRRSEFSKHESFGSFWSIFNIKGDERTSTSHEIHRLFSCLSQALWTNPNFQNNFQSDFWSIERRRLWRRHWYHIDKKIIVNNVYQRYAIVLPFLKQTNLQCDVFIIDHWFAWRANPWPLSSWKKRIVLFLSFQQCTSRGWRPLTSAVSAQSPNFFIKDFYLERIWLARANSAP